MALRDKFLAEMPEEDMNAPAPMANDEAMLDAKMGEADAVFDEMMGEVAPEGEFSSNALNTLIDKVNNTLKLFGEQAAEVPQVAEETEEFPTELVKAIKMIQQAGIDSGVQESPMDLGSIVSDGDLKRLAGEIDALGRNQSFKTFLKTSGDVNGSLLVDVELEPAGSAPQVNAPEMDEDEMTNLFTRRMK